MITSFLFGCHMFWHRFCRRLYPAHFTVEMPATWGGDSDQTVPPFRGIVGYLLFNYWFSSSTLPLTSAACKISKLLLTSFPLIITYLHFQSPLRSAGLHIHIHKLLSDHSVPQRVMFVKWNLHLGNIEVWMNDYPLIKHPLERLTFVIISEIVQYSMGH